MHPKLQSEITSHAPMFMTQKYQHTDVQGTLSKFPFHHLQFEKVQSEAMINPKEIDIAENLLGRR